MVNIENIDNPENTINDNEVFESELKDSSELSIQDILVSLISDKENLTLKTEIHNPRGITALSLLKEYFKGIKCSVTANIIGKLIDVYLEYMVSYNRKSRKEIIKALSSWIEKEYSQGQNRLLIGQE